MLQQVGRARSDRRRGRRRGGNRAGRRARRLTESEANLAVGEMMRQFATQYRMNGGVSEYQACMMPPAL